MNPRLPPHRQKLRDREAKVPTGVENLTGSDSLLSQGGKKLAVDDPPSLSRSHSVSVF
jgi:hypothetical protein